LPLYKIISNYFEIYSKIKNKARGLGGIHHHRLLEAWFVQTLCTTRCAILPVLMTRKMALFVY
jgi:hypothetical protein